MIYHSKRINIKNCGINIKDWEMYLLNNKIRSGGVHGALAIFCA